MKKITAIILGAALSASFIAGCGNQKLSDTDPTAASTNPNTAATSQNPQSFEGLYGNQLPRYMDFEYFFDGQPLMKQETNFYFINAFSDLTSYAQMGYCPATSLGYIDLDAQYSGEEYNTYGDYFVYYAENSIQSTCILCDRAAKEGITLDDETKKSIDDMMEEIKTKTAPAAGLSVNDYLQMHYGPGMDEESFRKVIERYYLADAYAQHYCTKPEFTEAIQAAKDEALKAATKMKDSCKTIDDLTGLAETAKENGTVKDQGDIAVPKGKMVKKFEEWAYGENRKVGEMDIIYAPEYGYFVVGYLGLTKDESSGTEVPLIRYALFYAPENNQEALQKMSDELLQEIKDKKHDFHKKEKKAPLEATDVLIVVFFTLGGVAILAVIVILIKNYMDNGKNGKNAKNSKNGKKSGNKQVPQKSSNPKAVKKKEEEPEDEEDD